MKRILALLLLTALLLNTGCATVKQAADVLGSDEAKATIKEGWNALADEIGEGAQKAKEEVGDAIGKVLPDTAHGYTRGGAELAAKGIHEIEVDWVSGVVEIAVYDGDTVSFSETSAGTLTERQQMRYRLEEGELHIVCCEAKLDTLPRKDLELRIPATLALESVEVDAVSASVDATDVLADEIDVKTVSGDITLRNLSCRELDVKSVSGPATLETCAVASEISVDTVSGNASIRLPAATAGFSVAFRTVSGTLRCQREGRVENGRFVSGDGNLKIEMESVSGNLSIS